MSGITRRASLKQLSGMGVAAISGAYPLTNRSKADDAKPTIAKENAQAGTREWLLIQPRVDASNRCPWIEGYCSHRSIRSGGTLKIHVSTNPASAFVIDIYRLGYYGSAGGRLMKSIGPLAGFAHPDPPIGEKRARICNWPSSAEFVIPDDWLSGVYVGKLTEQTTGIQSYIIFIVRDDREADYLFQCSDNTWQAYNRWPSSFSLYDDGDHEWSWGGEVQVSYRRPYSKYRQIVNAPLSIGSGEFFLWEFPFVTGWNRSGMMSATSPTWIHMETAWECCAPKASLVWDMTNTGALRCSETCAMPSPWALTSRFLGKCSVREGSV